VPFVRTSDISNWEIKRDPKHCVSDEVFEALASKQDVRAGDILMVRDGTYLIGTCAFVTEYDTRIVFQSHMYKLRVKKPQRLSPYLLLAALSSEPVQKQIQAKRFTQDIIDSLGDRITELFVEEPINFAVIGFFVVTALEALWVSLSFDDGTVTATARTLGHTAGRAPFTSRPSRARLGDHEGA
jgi:hypothetical protein